MTIRELMEEQRRRVRSSDPAERFAAALLLPAELAKRLRTVSSFRLGELLEHEVCSNLNLLAPELTVCAEAAERLRRTPLLAGRKHRSNSSTLDGEHILHAEATLYRAGIPYLLASVPARQVREQHLHGLGRGRRKSLLAGSGLSEDFPLSPIAD